MGEGAAIRDYSSIARNFLSRGIRNSRKIACPSKSGIDNAMASYISCIVLSEYSLMLTWYASNI